MAFSLAHGRLPHTVRRACCKKHPPVKAEVPVEVSIVAAGVRGNIVLERGVDFAVGIAGATFENLLNVIYNRRSTRKPSDDELCEYCSGFGQVRCVLCLGRGEIEIVRAKAIQVCPVCKGSKKEKCKRCAGRGISGLKKTRQPG